MTTMTCAPEVMETAAATKVENLPSDLEVFDRVHRIRSRWSVVERVRRRREAERRFEALLSALNSEA